MDFLSLLGDDAPSVGVGGAGSGDAPNPGVASAGEALAIPTSAPVALSPKLRLNASGEAQAKQRFGSGRHGSRQERSMQAAHMRARKAELNFRKSKAQMKSYSDQLILYLPGASALANCGDEARLGNQVTVQTMLDIGFSCRGRTEMLAQKHGISKKWVMALRLYIVAMFLACQNLLLGSLIMSAMREAPVFVLTRLAWDETSERAQLVIVKWRPGPRSTFSNRKK